MQYKPLFLIFLAGLATGCATPDVPRQEAPAAVQTPPPSSAPLPKRMQNINQEPIDVLGLQRSLGLERSTEDLGFAERSFNTCSAGYGFSASQNCRAKSFVSLHFRMQCRDSEGTISNVDYRVDPIVSDQVKWTLGRASGVTTTNTEGFGELLYIADSPQATERLRLTVDGHFLIVRAEEARRLIVPKAWCDPRR